MLAGPLAGLRVLDLSRVMAGPWCTQILADLGADVMKVERPGSGDETRQWGPPWLRDADGNETRLSSYFLSANRGKKSITIDIAKPEGQRLIRALAAKCDVLVENFKTGDLARKGLDFEALQKENSGLIYCSITGFGQTGPMAEFAGYDYLIQAQGGLMSITGVPDGKPGAGPQRAGLAVADLTTGMNSAVAILAALHDRDRTGMGQHIDMALLDVQVSWLANQAQNYFCSGHAPSRTGEYHPNLAPYQPFPTEDGSLIIAVGNDEQFKRLCHALSMPGLPEDTRFATNPARVKNRTALVELLEAATRKKSTHEWMDVLRRTNVPCGPIQAVDEVFEDPQVLARGMIVDIEHSEMGLVRTVANPIKFSSTPVAYLKAPPRLGEDTESILADLLAMAAEEIEELKRHGVT